jgi:3-hydroxybutyryl-CoA dehydratase
MEPGKTIDQISTGDRASLSKTITEADVFQFAEISGDKNPVHLDAEYTEKSRFRERIAHGMLTASLVSAVLGMKLPGPGSVYLSQSLEFKAPVKFGEVIEAEVEVIEKTVEKNRVRLKTVVRNQDGTTVLEGDAVLLPRKAPRR